MSKKEFEAQQRNKRKSIVQFENEKAEWEAWQCVSEQNLKTVEKHKKGSLLTQLCRPLLSRQHAILHSVLAGSAWPIAPASFTD
jgi:hypothetical protein